jgi:hypothetical protein
MDSCYLHYQVVELILCYLRQLKVSPCDRLNSYPWSIRPFQYVKIPLLIQRFWIRYSRCMRGSWCRSSFPLGHICSVGLLFSMGFSSPAPTRQSERRTRWNELIQVRIMCWLIRHDRLRRLSRVSQAWNRSYRSGMIASSLTPHDQATVEQSWFNFGIFVDSQPEWASKAWFWGGLWDFTGSHDTGNPTIIESDEPTLYKSYICARKGATRIGVNLTGWNPYSASHASPTE